MHKQQYPIAFNSICIMLSLFLQAVRAEQTALPSPLSVNHRSDTQKVQDRLWERTSNASITVMDETLVRSKDPVKRSVMAKALSDLGNLACPWTISLLVNKLELVYDRNINLPVVGLFPPQSVYPSIGALCRIGQPAIPVIIESMASQEHSTQFRHNALFVIERVVPASTWQYQINQYANEYEQKPLRFRTLAKQLPATTSAPPIPVTTPEQKPEARAGEDATKAAVARLARIFELQDILTSERLIAVDEAMVIGAISGLGQLQAVEAAPLLADKLDWERPAPQLNDAGQPIPTGIMAADPQGLLSPAITEAATKALLQIGKPALPAVLEAVSMRHRPPRFRSNALKLIVQLAGGVEPARAALLAAAEENEKKAQRLRDIAGSLPRVP